MKIRGAFLAGAAALLMSSASAMAADLGKMKGGSIKDGGYMPAQVQAPKSFYLRGDFGWATQDIGSMYEPPIYELSHKNISNTHLWGFGVGYYFSKNVRADFTLDWMSKSDLTGSVLDDRATVRGQRVFGVKNMVGLFNAYYDFDLRSHFTPYIGVGVGFAKNTTTSGFVNIQPAASDACHPDVATVTCSASFDGATQWNAAGALMAGVSAKLHDRLHFDAGYRFLYVGDSHTGPINITRTATAPGVTPTGPSTAADPYVFDQHAHQFRVGLRWDIK
jgi:opacity protein-like surface antigen